MQNLPDDATAAAAASGNSAWRPLASLLSRLASRLRPVRLDGALQVQAIFAITRGFWEIRDGLYRDCVDALDAAEDPFCPALAIQRSTVSMVAAIIAQAPSHLAPEDRAAILRNMARLGVRWVAPLRVSMSGRGEHPRTIAPIDRPLCLILRTAPQRPGPGLDRLT